MVVGDDEVDSSAPCALCSSKCTGAGIHADHQPNTGGCGALDHIATQVVAFADSVWDMKIRRAAAKFNCSF